MARLRSRMLRPPNSWFFIENGIKLDGGSFDDTVKLMTRHRKSNGLPIGNPERDLEEFTCHRAPQYCDGAARIQQTPPFREQFSTFEATYSAWMKAGYPLVDQIVANQRADTCWKCPFNQKVEEDYVKKGCCGKGKVQKILQAVAQGAVKMLTAPALRNSITPADAELYSCQLCGCANRPSVWIPLKYFAYDAAMRKKFSDETQGKCWKGKSV